MNRSMTSVAAALTCLLTIVIASVAATVVVITTSDYNSDKTILTTGTPTKNMITTASLHDCGKQDKEGKNDNVNNKNKDIRKTRGNSSKNSDSTSHNNGP